jgi:hypothetical protein
LVETTAVLDQATLAFLRPLRLTTNTRKSAPFVMDAAKDYFWKWWGGEHGNNKQHSQPVPHHQEVVVVETPVEDDPLSMIENKKLSHAERFEASNFNTHSEFFILAIADLGFFVVY